MSHCKLSKLFPFNLATNTIFCLPNVSNIFYYFYNCNNIASVFYKNDLQEVGQVYLK
jgi:hypothetical protein